MKGLLWDTQAFGFYPEIKLMDLTIPFRFVYRDRESKHSWYNLQAMRLCYRTVKIHVKMECYDPTIEWLQPGLLQSTMASVSSCSCWLWEIIPQIHHCQRFLPWWRFWICFKVMLFLCFLPVQARLQNLQLLKALHLGWGFFSPVSPTHPPNTQMICLKEEMKIKTVVVSIILYHHREWIRDWGG